jgi:hypothetical protein
VNEKRPGFPARPMLQGAGTGPAAKLGWGELVAAVLAVVAAVAGARDWWRRWRVVADRGEGSWLVAEVACSRDRWLEVAVGG